VARSQMYSVARWQAARKSITCLRENQNPRSEFASGVFALAVPQKYVICSRPGSCWKSSSPSSH
jgi:hypothetical protein